ncbi:MAG TPA: pyrroloquinoline quinone precursor peptide PqqA [Nevskia sp.]|nr:pyrroloquinoline quinone precursor peptide PqqA [Nevskia sp.]
MEKPSMKTWTVPCVEDLRFDMEVTMYILNR